MLVTRGQIYIMCAMSCYCCRLAASLVSDVECRIIRVQYKVWSRDYYPRALWGAHTTVKPSYFNVIKHIDHHHLMHIQSVSQPYAVIARMDPGCCFFFFSFFSTFVRKRMPVQTFIFIFLLCSSHFFYLFFIGQRHFACHPTLTIHRFDIIIHG